MTGKISILFAMRDRKMAESLRRELDDGENLLISIVSSGDEAYAHVCRFRPDMLVLDAVLAGMDGPGLIDRLRWIMADRMPHVIAGSMTSFCDCALRQRGVQTIVRIPWDRAHLRSLIREQAEEIGTQIDWACAKESYACACALLEQIGMRESLRGFAFLAWAAALAHQSEARLCGVSERLYMPIAERFGTTPQNVERLIRHAVESMMDSGKTKDVYGFFGNTIDPTRGKPTNAQILGLLVQRMRVRQG